MENSRKVKQTPPFKILFLNDGANLKVKLLCLWKFEGKSFVAREPEAAGNFVLPSGAYGLQARQEAREADSVSLLNVPPVTT